MSLALNIALLVSGLVLLWFSGEKTANYSKRLASSLGLEKFVFSFVVVALATNTPEIANAIVSSFSGVPGLSAGDLVGSAAVNLSLVVGITVLTVGGLKLGEKEFKGFRKAGLIASLTAIFLIFYGTLDIFSASLVILLFFSAIYLVEDSFLETDMPSGETSPGLYFMFVFWTGFLLVSSRMVVDSSIFLADFLGIKIQLIGATVVAVGTGLPELSYELNSARNGDYGMALGDALGSTLVNTGFLLGLLTVFNPGKVGLEGMLPALAVVALSSFLLMRSRNIGRKSGVALLILFCLYIPLTFLI